MLVVREIFLLELLLEFPGGSGRGYHVCEVKGGNGCLVLQCLVVRYVVLRNMEISMS